MATRLAEPAHDRHSAIAELVDALRLGSISSRKELEEHKRASATKYRLSSYPSNSEIFAGLSEEEKRKRRQLVCVKPRRSASGIVVVTVFSAPFACPHGTCTFCPGGPSIGTPQSYVADGPGMNRAVGARFDPFLQVQDCLRKYRMNGHDTSKVESIIEGGTFIALDARYQAEFIKGFYDGMNGAVSRSLLESQRMNELSDSRCVGLTIESKPDWCEPRHIDLMLTYGITRLEIGVQSLHDDVLAGTNRGHTTADTLRAFKTARDSGLKVVAHMMPGLPGSSPEEDLEDLKRLFEDDALRPDMLKVYPTLVVAGTALGRLYELGRYEPLSVETVVEMLAEIKRFIPKWHRIMRIQREIPERDILGGIKVGNLRELVLNRVREKGYSCKCIRCREVALSEPKDLGEDELVLNREKYTASEGTEIFCAYEFKRAGKIAGFVRMRCPSQDTHRREMRGSCVIRELKVYGRVVGIGTREAGGWQHRGLGVSLLKEMERTARDSYDCRRILVTSAVGTREYYRRFGYRPLGPYMAKLL